MMCPLRAAAFLAHVRHETDGFRAQYQPLDMGAGAIHMIPYNFRLACRAIPVSAQRLLVGSAVWVATL